MSTPWFFFHQVRGGEEDWVLGFAETRDDVTRKVKPAFVSVLDLTAVPEDHDWAKVKYRGPWYFDFDADGDLELACQQFKVFLGKLDSEFDFDITQARLFASGGKGFHVEIPQECFLPKVPVAGYAWLPYIYRAMAEAVVVDTMDMRVYSGKRGRMWRTPGVQRENGNYKVALSVADALEITPESYLDLVRRPRGAEETTPPHCNSKMAMLFERSRDKVVTHMRGRKKRLEKSNALLDPWRKSGKHPATIERLMSGEIVADGAGFNRIAMQLAIYATSVAMPLETFLEKCKGLCETYVGDSARYGSYAKRREQLADQYRYMDENAMYEFDPAPIIKLVKPGTSVADLGVMDTEDPDDRKATTASVAEGDQADGDTTTIATPQDGDDAFKGVRKGFFVNGQGMYRKTGDVYEPLCRATVRNVESFYDVERQEFKGFEFDLILPKRRPKRAMLASEAFTSCAAIKKFFAAHQVSFQGTDPDAMGLLDVMVEKSSRGGSSYCFPREGFFLIDHPTDAQWGSVMCYLTQDEFISSIKEGDEGYFKLRYRPTQAISSYMVDIHKAPELSEEHRPALHDLFSFTRPDIAADLIGWMVACTYRSLYLKLFNQFPLLQVYGDAGAGKSQTIWMLAHLHWYKTEVSVKSAMSCTPFAMDSHASTSTSAPFILDEYKPRELSRMRGRLEKIKDVFKASYIGGDIGERGTINRGAENSLAVIKSKATAPIVFMGEAIEMETAIVERSVCVPLSQSYQSKQRKLAFDRLHKDRTALSALGRELIELGFLVNLDQMREDFEEVLHDIEVKQPDFDTAHKRLSSRMLFNRAVVIHGLRVLQKVLRRKFDDTFDAAIDSMIDYKVEDKDSEQSRVIRAFGMSEASKVLNRMAILSRDEDVVWGIEKNKDYCIGDGWMEMKVERCYDKYRRFCVAMNDAPLFDSLETFLFAMNTYAPAIDKVCAQSPLRQEGSQQKIVRFSLNSLSREGVQTFRDV